MEHAMIRRHAFRRQRASALLIVILCVALLGVLVVSYLDGMKTSVSTSSAFAAKASARRAADSAQALALSQIKTATSGGTTVAWASQPGAIRTYDNTGAARSIFKLYSAPQMIAAASSFDPSADLPPAGWASTPGLYVDLNAPLQNEYPIINPAAAVQTSGQSLVDGFSIDAGSAPLSGATNAAAMPARWIYQLKDGSLVVPQTATGKTTIIPGASPTNPPIARFAFWTDDETCKLNINTASEGSYWDVPMMANPAELYFARYQPARREFQRYPGHPATTSLSPVLWSFLGLDNPAYSLTPSLNPQRNGTYFSTKLDVGPQLTSTALGYYDQLFKIAPRIVLGGSQMGAIATVTSTNVAISAIDDDRLYATVDELLFARSSTASPQQRPTNPPLSQDSIDKVRFFLTANSRAPEVNLFNQPKITMWPIDDPSSANPGNPYNAAPDSRSPLDKLIAFCSTLNGYAYYFSRNSPLSTSADFQGRNLDLYNYFDRMLGQNIPGYGASFSSRYGATGSDEIATLFYDYIRSNINLADSSGGNGSFTASGTANSQYAFAPGKNDNLFTGRGQVVPFRHPSNNTKGIGRFPTIRQCMLWFVVRAANQPPVLVNSDLQPIDTSGNVITGPSQTPVLNPMHPWIRNPGSPVVTSVSGSLGISISGTCVYPSLALSSTNNLQTHAGLPYLTVTGTDGKFNRPNPRYPSSLPALAAHQTLIQPVFTFEPVNSSVGNVALNPNYQVVVKGLDAFTANGVPLGLASSATSISVNPGNGVATIQYAEDLPLRFRRITGSTEGSQGAPRLTFAGQPFIVSSSTFAFHGGDITIEMRDMADEIVQKLAVNFPDATFPTPMLPSFGPPNFLLYSVNGGSMVFPPAAVQDLIPSTLLTVDSGDSLASDPNFGTDGTFYKKNVSRLVFSSTGSADSNADPGKNLFLPERSLDPNGDTIGRSKLTCDTIRSVECKYGDARLIAALANVPSSFFTPHKDYFDPSIRSAQTGNRGGTVQPLTDAPVSLSSPTLNYFASGWGIPTGASNAIRSRIAVRPDGTFGLFNLFPNTTSSTDFGNANFQSVWASGGDFDNGLGLQPDGPYINKPEEGTALTNSSGYANPYYDAFVNAYAAVGATLFSPNRQVPSSVVFGSLPSGINPNSTGPEAAWRTFLFSPNPNSKTHAALGANPPDYALLDFFHMPVVEPYAISEPLSTAGKVNMNYQIVPFTYIHRDTALRGVLKAVDLTAIRDKMRYTYKGGVGSKSDQFGDSGGTLDQASIAAGYWDSRYPIHAGETLKQFDAKFASGNLFRSASEICSLWLYPATQPTSSTPDAPATALVTYDPAAANIKSWWYDDSGGNRKSLTGDNLRERPYALLYPRLTTKSNTYTIHVRSQALDGRVAADGTIDDAVNPVSGEWRGSFLIERYINPSDPSLPDFASSANASKAVDSYYRFRTIATKQFNP